MTTPTTTPQPFTHEAHAFDWLKLHHRPIITAAIAGFLVVVVVRWWVDRIRSRRRDAEANWSRPVGRVLHDAVKVRKVTRRGGRIVYMRLRYGPDAILYGPAFANLEANLSEQLGIPITVETDRERRLIHLRLEAPPKPVEEVPANPLADRALKVAHQLLGPESRVVNFVPQINGKAQELTVTHGSIKDADDTFRQTVDAHMQAKLGQKLQSQWETQYDRATWRAVPDLPAYVPHPANPIADNHVIPFGVDANDNIVEWDLDSDVPHCMVAGATGTGKSSTLLTMLTEATRRGIEVQVCDYKRISLRGLRDWPGVTRVALDIDDIADTLIAAEAERADRAERIDNGLINEDDLTPLIIAMEEGPATLIVLADAHRRNGGEDGKPGKGDAPAKLAFDNLAFLGRQCRIHLLVAFQRPDAKVIGGAVRDQFGCRVLLGRPKRGTREMLELDRSISAGPRGRGVADTGDGAREIQGWKTPDPARYAKLSPADRAIIDGLRPPAAQPPTFHVAPPAAPEPEPIAPLLPFVPRIVEAEPEPAAPTTKRCRGECGQTRPLDDFGRDKHRPDGLNVRCRECDRAEVAARRAAKRPVSTGSGEKAP